MSATAIQPLGLVWVELTMEIQGSREAVWRALTTAPGDWWPEEFCATSAPRTMTMDLRPGGALAEVGGEGKGVLWGTVLAYEPPVSLSIAAHLAPPFSKPAVAMLHIQLEESGDGTRMVLRDGVMGQVSDKTAEQGASGWEIVFGGLKRHVEASG